MRLSISIASLVAAAALVAACTTANEQALTRMSAQQRNFLDEKIGRLRPDMSERHVTEVLGLPIRGAGEPRVCYQAPGDDRPTEVCIRFELYKARYVDWIAMGENGFEYSVDLQQPAK
ncbi:MAG: hypothetical protein JXR83_10635 [Deltaproteobacteria bacterium]|nr:hypothetical protein [Deltaproteobacteria bacterium]